MYKEYITLKEASSLSWKSVVYLRKLSKNNKLKSDTLWTNKIHIFRDDLVKMFWIDQHSEVYYNDQIKNLKQENWELKEKCENYRSIALVHKEEEVKIKWLLLDENSKYSLLEGKNRFLKYIISTLLIILFLTTLSAVGIITVNL